MDLGDNKPVVCVLNAAGAVVEQTAVAATPEAVTKFFQRYRGAVVAMETGTHSRWVSRSVGAFFGLVPRRDQSGQTDQQLRTTKTGDPYVRRLLVGSAHYILGPFGPPCDLRRYGERIAKRGGKNAKKRAVLLHALWKTATDYQPPRVLPSAA